MSSETRKGGRPPGPVSNVERAARTANATGDGAAWPVCKRRTCPLGKDAFPCAVRDLRQEALDEGTVYCLAYTPQPADSEIETIADDIRAAFDGGEMSGLGSRLADLYAQLVIVLGRMTARLVQQQQPDADLLQRTMSLARLLGVSATQIRSFAGDDGGDDRDLMQLARDAEERLARRAS